MLKPLLFILVIVILLATVLNFDFLFPPVTPKKTVEVVVKEKIVIKKPVAEVIDKPLTVKPTTPVESTLLQELELLLHQAKELFRQNKDSEALVIYETIIDKSIKSTEVKVLKIFAEACFEKATIHYIYPNNDKQTAMETYEVMTKRLEHNHNKELLLTYMQGKINLAQFSMKEEQLIIYDHLIEKFTKDPENRFTKEIEELLFSKSFVLMGLNDEEAIEVLDRIIAKYDDTTKLPQTVKFAILNNIELSIITNNEPDKYVDLANQYMADSPDTKPLLEMLSIIKNAQDLDQTEAIKKWKSAHDNYNFPDWDFSELRKWVSKMEIPATQLRINNCLDIFENQKFKIYYQAPPQNASTQTTDSSTNNQNQENGYYEIPIENEAEDPYLNDIWSSESLPIIYSDTYNEPSQNSYPDPYAPNDGENF